MAHGLLKKSTQIKTKQHVGSFFYGIDVRGALASVLSVPLCLVPFWTTQPSYYELHPTGFELSSLMASSAEMQIHTHMLLGMELVLSRPSSKCQERFVPFQSKSHCKTFH